MSDQFNIADTALMAPQYDGSAVRQFILALMDETDGLNDAITQLAVAGRAVERVLNDLRLEQAMRMIELHPVSAAVEWFLDNVPLDAPYRTEVYFRLKERLKEA